MKGQAQASTVRLGGAPARERLAHWADARVRKRRREQARHVELIAALAEQQRRALRGGRGGVGPSVNARRLPY